VTRVFLTGLSGQDGSYLAERLVGEGHEVHGAVHDADGVPEEIAVRFPGVTVHRGDLADPQGLSTLVRGLEPDWVVNLGGISSVALSWERPALVGAVSGVGAVALMEAVRSLPGARMLQASSAEIFGQAAEYPQNENTPISPTSPYGAAKAYAHRTAAIMRSSGADIRTCILYNHESPRRPETFVTRKITATVARIARGLEDALELGNTDSRRDWGWAPDYVDAMVRILSHDEPDDFVVATGESHTVEQFVAAAFSAAGIDDYEGLIRINPAYVRPVDPGLQVGDATKAHETLGWKPTVEFEEIVRRMVWHDLELLDASGAA